jgi:hypothetical protein
MPLFMSCALIWASVMMDIWVVVLVRVVVCTCDAVSTPSMIEDVRVLCVSDTQVVVIFRLVERIEYGFMVRADRLEFTDECEEAGAGIFVVLVFELVIVV